jgi:DNA-binding beta-propeller fold protein YncE
MRVLLCLAVLAASACGGNQPSASPTPIAMGKPTEAPTPGASRPATPIPVATGTPLGDRLVATISVPLAPCAMAVDATSAWITGSATAELVRVDPATNAVADSIKLDGSPCGVALGSDGRIWVALLGTGAVVAVDPATKQVAARIDHVGPQLWDLKAGFGAIWVVDRSARTVLRIDPTKATIIARVPVGPEPGGLAVMPAGVWVSDDIDGMLRRIDPATNQVAATSTAGGAPSWFADDGAATLFIAERGSGQVASVDPTTGVVGTPVAGFDEPLDGTIVGSEAWIPEGSGRRLGVIALGSAGPEVVRYALPGAVNPFVAEPGFGDVWVLDFGGRTIWRVRP